MQYLAHLLSCQLSSFGRLCYFMKWYFWNDGQVHLVILRVPWKCVPKPKIGQPFLWIYGYLIENKKFLFILQGTKLILIEMLKRIHLANMYYGSQNDLILFDGTPNIMLKQYIVSQGNSSNKEKNKMVTHWQLSSQIGFLGRASHFICLLATFLLVGRLSILGQRKSCGLRAQPRRRDEEAETTARSRGYSFLNSQSKINTYNSPPSRSSFYSEIAP